MKKLINLLTSYRKIIYIVFLSICFLPFITPPIALFFGAVLSFTSGQAFPRFNAKTSKYLLQASVVCLGFGMNLHQALESGKDGMVFTIFSVMGTLLVGSILAWLLKVNTKTGYLISSGTAICGGSAIAAIGPVIKAEESDMTIALGTIFILNAIALLTFPFFGHLLQLSQHQFGLWAAISIHDTSSVVGAGAAYGSEALKVATTVKLTRALWILPVAFLSSFIFKSKSDKVYIPWFIFLFILTMVANTFLSLPNSLTNSIVWIAHKGLTITLFMIGNSLTQDVLKKVGIRPMIQGVLLWIFISVSSLLYIMYEI